MDNKYNSVYFPRCCFLGEGAPLAAYLITASRFLLEAALAADLITAGQTALQAWPTSVTRPKAAKTDILFIFLDFSGLRVRYKVGMGWEWVQLAGLACCVGHWREAVILSDVRKVQTLSSWIWVPLWTKSSSTMRSQDQWASWLIPADPMQLTNTFQSEFDVLDIFFVACKFLSCL